MDDMISTMRAKGVPMTSADLAGQKIPDDRNGAALYERAFECLSTGDKSDLRILSEFLRPDKYRRTDKSWSDVAYVVRRNSEALEFAREAAQKPQCRFSDKGVSLLSVKARRIRDIARLLAAKSIIESKEGKTGEWVESIKLGIRTDESLSARPTLIDQLVRIAALSITSRAARECLSSGKISYDQAKDLYDSFGAVDLENGFVRGVSGDRILNDELMTRYRGWMVLVPLFKNVDIATINPRRPFASIDVTPFQKLKYRVLGDAYGRSGVLGDQLALLGLTSRTMDSAKMCYRDAKCSGLVDSQRYPFYAVVTNSISPVCAMAVKQLFTARCQLNGDRVLIAILAYKARYGTYPQTLNEAETRLGWKFPKDPYTDQGFKYKASGAGFVLSSVGPNLQDDGGVQHIKGHFDPAEKGDFIWRWDQSHRL